MLRVDNGFGSNLDWIPAEDALAISMVEATIHGVPHQHTMPYRPNDEAVAEVGRCNPKRKRWGFYMITDRLLHPILMVLLERSKMPRVSIKVLSYMLSNYHPYTGWVDTSRKELADMFECHPNDISHITGELEKLNLLRRIPQGRGTAYKINPWLATGLPESERDAAHAEWGPPRLNGLAPTKPPAQRKRPARARPPALPFDEARP